MNDIVWHATRVDRRARAQLKAQTPCIVWFTGLPSAGKSTVANALERRLHAAGRHTYLLDGDNVRHGLNGDLGFSAQDRAENIRRVAEVGKLFVDAGIIVITAFISPSRAERRAARALFTDDEFIEVFIDTPLEVCEQRDPKGMYRKARAGQLPNFTGVGAQYESPQNAEVILQGDASADEFAAQVMQFLTRRWR